MNVIEAAKAAGWPGFILDMLKETEDMKRLERFAQIIRNQALEEAAVCCDELKPTNHYYERYDSDWATGTLDCCEAIRALKGAKE